MGFLDKLMFWKKDDLSFNDLSKSLNVPTGIDTNIGMQHQGYGQQSYGTPGYGQQPYQDPGMGLSQPPQSFQPLPQDQQIYTMVKDIEVISYKLDAIKAAIETLSQRIANLERATYGNDQNSVITKRYFQDMPPRTY
jgi:hypothetical protein